MESPATNADKSRPDARWFILGLIVLVGTAIAFAVLWNSEKATQPAEVTRFLQDHAPDAGSVAAQVIVGIVDYDAETYEENQERLLEMVTGSFLEDYEELLGGNLGEVLAETNTVSEGEIVDGPDVGFLSATRAQATARVAQQVSTDASPEKRLVLLVLQVGLVLESDGWKAEELTILSQQSPGSD